MTTAADVMHCDHCKNEIESLDTAMLFWRPRAREEEGAQNLSLTLAHKRCQERRRRDEVGEFSAELYWFADQACGAARVADMALSYAFSADELKRLILVTWAAPLGATKKDKKDAQKFAEFF